LDDSALLENHMMPSYPMGLNVLLARVGGVVYAVQACARIWHARCSQESWRAILLLVHATTGGSIFGLANSLMRLKLGLVIYSTKSEDGKLFINLK